MSSEAGEGASTSATPQKEQMEAKMQAHNLLAQGKRNLICKEVPAAVQQFQDACQLLSTSFGEMAKECAEAYFHYGGALLDLSRMEQDVLGNALDGVDVDAEDEEEENATEQFETPTKADEKDPKSEEKETTEEEEEGEEEDEGEEGEEGGSQDGGDQEGEGEQDGEDPDDVSNLQLSWEMLELAKIIYLKDPSKESQLKAAEACLKLGEVSLETEQYDQAISDLETCLNIQTQNLDQCDRSIAVTYYQLGLACQMNKELEKAKDYFSRAVKCLEEKMNQLKVIIEEKPPKSPSQFIEPAEKAEKEVKDIMDILPEIKEKINDTVDEMKTMDNLKSMAKEAMGSIFSAVGDSTTEFGFGGASSSSISTSPVKSTDPQKTSNISHLVRKKRKPDEETKEEEEDLDNKKQKGTNGTISVNGVSEEKETPSETTAAT